MALVLSVRHCFRLVNNDRNSKPSQKWSEYKTSYERTHMSKSNCAFNEKLAYRSSFAWTNFCMILSSNNFENYDSVYNLQPETKCNNLQRIIFSILQPPTVLSCPYYFKCLFSNADNGHVVVHTCLLLVLFKKKINTFFLTTTFNKKWWTWKVNW